MRGRNLEFRVHIPTRRAHVAFETNIVDPRDICSNRIALKTLLEHVEIVEQKTYEEQGERGDTGECCYP
jgi:cell fate regulator YaaT (PSP1 superfamily)